MGLYLGSKTIRASVNGMIDKYLLKKKNMQPPTKQTSFEEKQPQQKRTVTVNGIKYTEDTTQDHDRNI